MNQFQIKEGRGENGTGYPMSDGGELTVFDPSVLCQFVGDDEAIINGFLREYIISADAIGSSISEAIDKKDWQMVGELAHRLKSSSLTVGALLLGELCTSLETACNEAEFEQAMSLAATFSANWTCTMKQIRRHVSTSE
tara:strand:+ start:429 stop:845 length:417 start_codon:yes stop_codon:yes gene_type:complete